MSSSKTSSEYWREALLPKGSSFKDAISCLNRSSMQMAIVVNEEGRIVGTLTDGDIRRGLLRGLDLTSPVAGIIHHDPIVVPPSLDRDTVLQLMRANKIHQLPVIDENRFVVGLHLWDELLAPSVRPNTMVIMAGGRGQRLMPHTENCPKPLLPVAGKPMLQHIIERAQAEGFNQFVLSVHYLGHMIEEYFGDGRAWNINIQYLREDLPLGTAGALGLLDPLPSSPLVVTNGDVLSDIRYGELLDFHVRQGAAASMAVRLYEWQHPFGVVQTKGVDIVGFEEKPVHRTHINAGIYALNPEVLSRLRPAAPLDMPSLFERLQSDGQRTVAFPMHEPWLDVGRPDDLIRAGRINAVPPHFLGQF